MRLAISSFTLRLTYFAALPLCVLVACDSGYEPSGPGLDDDESPVGAGPDGGAATDRDGPTFYADVAPILARNCTTCHQPGGIAPFTLIEYAEVKPLASSIKRVTQSRTMPPFLPDNS